MAVRWSALGRAPDPAGRRSAAECEPAGAPLRFSLQGSQYSAASSFQTGVTAGRSRPRRLTGEIRRQRLHLASLRSKPALSAMEMGGLAWARPASASPGRPTI